MPGLFLSVVSIGGLANFIDRYSDGVYDKLK
jgi:hypothetical protein